MTALAISPNAKWTPLADSFTLSAGDVVCRRMKGEKQFANYHSLHAAFWREHGDIFNNGIIKPESSLEDLNNPDVMIIGMHEDEGRAKTPTGFARLLNIGDGECSFSITHLVKELRGRKLNYLLHQAGMTLAMESGFDSIKALALPGKAASIATLTRFGYEKQPETCAGYDIYKIDLAAMRSGKKQLPLFEYAFENLAEGEEQLFQLLDLIAQARGLFEFEI